MLTQMAKERGVETPTIDDLIRHWIGEQFSQEGEQTE